MTKPKAKWRFPTRLVIGLVLVFVVSYGALLMAFSSVAHNAVETYKATISQSCPPTAEQARAALGLEGK